MIFIRNGIYNCDSANIDFIYRGRTEDFLEVSDVYGYIINGDKLTTCIIDYKTFKKDFKYVKQYEPVTLWQKIKRLFGRNK